jgi:hypothetical protein
VGKTKKTPADRIDRGAEHGWEAGGKRKQAECNVQVLAAWCWVRRMWEEGWMQRNPGRRRDGVAVTAGGACEEETDGR